MNGYSKIRFVSTTKSKSIDFSDLFSPPQTPKPISNPPPIIEEANSNSTQTVPSSQDNEGARFGEILSRNCSNTSHRFKNGEKEKQSSAVVTTTATSAAALQTAVKRAFSMRRSCSVSEGYSRIYDQSDDDPPVWSPISNHQGGGEGDDFAMQTRSNNRKNKKKKRRGSRILKACGTNKYSSLSKCNFVVSLGCSTFGPL